MQLSQTLKMKEIELIIQAAFKFCICLQTNRKSQFGVMVQCLFRAKVVVGLIPPLLQSLNKKACSKKVI